MPWLMPGRWTVLNRFGQLFNHLKFRLDLNCAVAYLATTQSESEKA